MLVVNSLSTTNIKSFVLKNNEGLISVPLTVITPLFPTSGCFFEVCFKSKDLLYITLLTLSALFSPTSGRPEISTIEASAVNLFHKFCSISNSCFFVIFSALSNIPPIVSLMFVLKFWIILFNIFVFTLCCVIASIVSLAAIFVPALKSSNTVSANGLFEGSVLSVV